MTLALGDALINPGPPQPGVVDYAALCPNGPVDGSGNPIPGCAPINYGDTIAAQPPLGILTPAPAPVPVATSIIPASLSAVPTWMWLAGGAVILLALVKR